MVPIRRPAYWPMTLACFLPACVFVVGRGTIPIMAENLTGIIERVTFHNPDTGFAVLRVQVRGRRGLMTVVGQMPSAVVGEYIQAAGEWIQDRTHGEQFKAD